MRVKFYGTDWSNPTLGATVGKLGGCWVFDGVWVVFSAWLDGLCYMFFSEEGLEVNGLGSTWRFMG